MPAIDLSVVTASEPVSADCMTESARAGETKVPDEPPSAPGADLTESAGNQQQDPKASTAASFDCSSPGFYLNRELTWLEYARRVLHIAEESRTPLLERLRFIAITSTILDEFFMKRIGGLKQQVGAHLQRLTSDGRTPQQQITECCTVIRDIEAHKEEILLEILRSLNANGVRLMSYDQLTEKEKSDLREYFLENIFPLVTPQAIDPAHPFPFISNLSVNLLVTLRYADQDDELRARVKVPVGSGIPRFLRTGGGTDFVALEEIMSHNLDLLFPKLVIDACEVFQVTRNANTERSEEGAEDLLAMIESELRDRRFAPIVRLVVGQGMNPQRRSTLAAEFGLDETADVFDAGNMLDMADLMELAELEVPELRYPPHHPANHAGINEQGNIFYEIRDAPVLLQHPYESFSNTVERFLKQASRDPRVMAIKMTLYRTSYDTKVIDYLIDAAQNGKQVAVVVEIKARFDEANNIRWASRLEEAGIHVTYGVVGLKTHCKIILVVRQDYDGLRLYVHVGTGNYHAGTARQYDDLGLMTCDEAVGRDAVELFNYLTTGYTPKRKYKKLLPAPKALKRQLIGKIQREARVALDGDAGHIQIKVNALEDTDVIRELYLAARAGVKIDLIVRDSCRLRPGIPELTENVRVISVVGRFLEHSRIYYFRNGGADEFYIGSADAMRRSFEDRVEVLVPVEDARSRDMLRIILDLHLADDTNAWIMQPDGQYLKRQPEDGNGLSCQERLAELAEGRQREAQRLKRRKPKMIGRRNAGPAPASA